MHSCKFQMTIQSLHDFIQGWSLKWSLVLVLVHMSYVQNVKIVHGNVLFINDLSDSIVEYT